MLAPMLLSALFAASITAPDSAHSRNHTCKAVTGEISARATGLSPSLGGLRIRAAGRSQGDLDGAVSIEVVKPYVGRTLKTSFVIKSADGAITISGVTTIARSDSVAGIRPLHFENEHRDFLGDGVVDHRNRLLRFNYSGRMCQQRHAVESSTRTKRIAVVSPGLGLAHLEPGRAA